MRTGWIALGAGLLLVAGCAQHSQAWDDAWAECQAKAVGNQDTYEGDDDQRSAWLMSQTKECMEGKGFGN